MRDTDNIEATAPYNRPRSCRNGLSWTSMLDQDSFMAHWKSKMLHAPHSWLLLSSARPEANARHLGIDILGRQSIASNTSSRSLCLAYRTDVAHF
jgi:hypothetical protein